MLDPQTPKPLLPRLAKARLTQIKHISMFPKTISLKLQSNSISAPQLNALNLVFAEANNFQNYCIQHQKNIKSLDTSLKLIPIFLKDGTYLMRSLNILSSQMKQGIRARIMDNLASIKTANDKIDFKESKPKLKKEPKTKKSKKKDKAKSKTQLKKEGNRKPKRHGKASKGSLQFKTECNSIPLQQFGITYRLERINSTIKIQNIPGWFKTNGMEQIPEYADICNANLVRKNGSYYLNIFTYLPKKPIPKNQVIQSNIPIGIDFGIDTQITTSDGTKITWNIQPSKKLRRLTRKCFKRRNKKTKIPCRIKGTPRIRNRGGRPDSNNRKKDFAKRKKLYEKLKNQRDDNKNRVVSYLTKQHSTIVMQEDSIKAWATGGMGKKVAGTGLGKIKAALRDKAVISVMIPSSYPSTKTCSNCGAWQRVHRGMKVYECPSCGFRGCRDENGAKSTLVEGIKLNLGSIIQMNGEKAYHIMKEQDMIRESNRVKELESTKEMQEEWIAAVSDSIRNRSKGEEVCNTDKRSEDTCGAHEFKITPYATVHLMHGAEGEVFKPRENLTAGSPVGREMREQVTCCGNVAGLIAKNRINDI